MIIPEIAVTDSDIKCDKITADDFTKKSYETANKCNPYFNTIGHKTDPNYRSTLKTNRQQVRPFDAPYDFNPHHHPNHQQSLDEFRSTITLSEIKCHTKKLKNNKKTYECDLDPDNLHTIIIKESMDVICDTLQIVLNY